MWSPPKGGAERQLTFTPEQEGRLEWSSDGRRVLYSVARDNKSELFVVDSSTATSTHIGSINGRGLIISSDGKRVTFTAGSWQESGPAVANIDGSDQRILTSQAETRVGWNTHLSPDGRMVAFTGQDSTGQLHIFIVGVDGKGVRQLTRFTPDEGRAQGPSWSPDGRSIAFQLDKKGSSRIWGVNLNDGVPHELSRSDAMIRDEAPVWFPDGTRIAFQSTRSSRMEIWTANADGSHVRQVTNGGGSK
jgi:TolB protein